MNATTAPTFRFPIHTAKGTVMIPSVRVAEEFSSCKCCDGESTGGWWCVSGDIYCLACVVGMIEEDIIAEADAVLVPTRQQVADRALPYGIN